MTQLPPGFTGLTLFTQDGERKYLSQTERQRFHEALSIIEDLRDRSFCEMIYWTGCRPSEALALTALNIDVEEQLVVIRSLKKRGKWKNRHFRPVPVPQGFIERMEETHTLRLQQASCEGKNAPLLWRFGRTKGWRLIRTVMRKAGITGAKGCGRGLRHAYGVHAAINAVPESRIKKWLGHESLATTEIYLDVAGPEDRLIASRMWAEDT